MFFKALAVAAVNIEITLGKKYPAFGKISNGQRRLQLSDALMACAPSRRQHVGRGANIRMVIQRAKRSRQQRPGQPLWRGRQVKCVVCSVYHARWMCELCACSVCKGCYDTHLVDAHSMM